MCGIAGFTGEYQTEVANSRIRIMTDSMAHRGPDAEGFIVRPGIALGHRRLSIIDLSDSANQPMQDHTGRFQLVYNGELYNYQSIKEELSDYPFQTQSDTEVVLAAYARWGVDCLSRFNGMFALAIWDEKEESLFVARDRMGIKPLYYSYDNEHFAFSSEVRAILKSGYAKAELDLPALTEYLSYYSVNAPRTLIKDIFMLMPGHYGLLKDGDFSQHAYWTMWESAVWQEDISYEECCKQILSNCRDAVTRRLMSDVPFGAFLSGGIDSSAVVALMSQASEQAVHTFSIIFNEKDYDESAYSSLIAKKYGTRHHPILLSSGDFLKALPDALHAMDHPSGDAVNSYVVSAATKKEGFTVALSGLGGDELFAGYPVFKRYERLRRMNYLYHIPQTFRAAISQSISTVYRNHKTARLQNLLTAPTNDFSHLYPVFREIFSVQETQALIKNHTDSSGPLLDSIFSAASLLEIEKLPFFSQISVGELSTYTANILLRDTDQMSMAHSLEVRVPFLDHTLVSLLLGVPDRFKRPDYPKKLLVDALGDLIPGEIVHRPKMGFSFPWESWIRNELQPLCAHNMQSLAKRDFFNSEAVLQIWKRFLAGDKKISWIKVWMLSVLENWLSNNEIHA